MEFKIEHECTEEEKEMFGEARIRITNFKKVTIFIGNKTKIIYRKGLNLFVIEDLDSEREDVDDYTSTVDGPEAISIVDTIIRSAKRRGATIIWSGIHYEVCNRNSSIEDVREIDYVEDEMKRKSSKKNKEKIDYTLVENDRRKSERRKSNEKTRS